MATSPDRVGIPRLQVRLFGSPSVLLDGRPVSAFTSAKVQALFLYLVAAGGEHRRAALATMLWPDTSERKAQNSLRNALAVLRKLFPGRLATDRHTASLRQDDLWLDTAQFEHLLERTGDPSVDLLQVETAVSLFADDLLAGFHLQDAPLFEEWAAATRLRLHDAVVHALLELAQWQMERRDYAASLDVLSRLITLEPGSESAHRLKMRLLARLGHRSAAIMQFEACRRYLAEELGVDPEPATMALYDLLLEGQLEPSPTGVPDVAAMAPAMVEPRGLATRSPEPAYPQVDWGEMPGRTALFGRTRPVAQLMDWLTGGSPALIVIAGLGGVGKTTLATEAVHQLASAPVAQGGYDRILWRSVLNAPPVDDVLHGWLRALLPAPPDPRPESRDEALALLFSLLQSRRCLLVLDNFESVMEGSESGNRADYAGYQQLVERMAHGHHRSCLLITTRTAPRQMRRLTADYARVHLLELDGLAASAGAELLRARGLPGSEPALASLAARYSGNPLALRLVAATIADLFSGDVAAFLGEETVVFDDIRDVLDQQFGRLTDLEREVLTWLAVKREPVVVNALWDDLATPPSRWEFIEAVRALRRSSLLSKVVHHGQDGTVTSSQDADSPQLTLQNVVMEYVADCLLEQIRGELEEGRLACLHRFALCQADAPQYVQDVQERLYLEPLSRWMLARWGLEGSLQRLRRLLDLARSQQNLTTGYTGANVVHLMQQMQNRLEGEDFSRLSLRQADLRAATLIGVDLRGADLSRARFADNFGSIWSVALSPDGRYLAASADRDVLLWRMPALLPHAVLQGHTNFMLHLAFSADGRHLASAGRDGSLSVWEVASGELLASAQAPAGAFDAVAFSADGETLAYGSSGGVISVWKWQDRRQICALEAGSSIAALALGRHGRVLAGAGSRGDVQCWDVESQALLYTLPGSGSHVSALAISADGAWAVVASEDKAVRIWDLHSQERCGALEGHATWALALAISPDGTHLATAGADGNVRVWDRQTGQPNLVLHGHRGWVRAVVFSPDGRTLVSGGYDQSVRLWDLPSGRQQHYLKGYLRWVSFSVFSPDSSILAGVTVGGVVHLWRTHDGKAWTTLRLHQAPVRALAFSPDGRQIASSGDDNRAYLCDVQTGAVLHQFQGHTDFVRAVAFDRTGRTLVTGSHDNTIRLWDAASGRLLRTLLRTSATMLSELSFHPQGRYWVYGTQESTVDLFDLDAGVVVHSLPLAAPPNVAVFCPRGRHLACGGKDGCITVWELGADGGELWFTQRYQVHLTQDRVWRMLFSPDGSSLAWNCEGKESYVLDVASGKLRFRVPGKHGAFCLAFTADSRHLLTDGPDHCVQMHDAKSGETRAAWVGHTSDLTSIAVSPNGELIASTDTLGTVHLWRAHTGAPQRLEIQGPYAGARIAGATGLTQGQRLALTALGAVEAD